MLNLAIAFLLGVTFTIMLFLFSNKLVKYENSDQGVADLI